MQNKQVKIHETGFAVFVIVVAVLVFCGWIFNITALTSISESYLAMNPLTSVLFILSGIALLNVNSRKNQVLFCVIPALIVGLAGLLRFFSFITGYDIPIDVLLFPGSLHGTRMAPNSALNFFLSGTALILISSKNNSRISIAHVLTLFSFVLSMLGVLGFIYTSRSLSPVKLRFPMAIHTSVSFIILNIGIFMAKQERGYMSVISAKLLGGNLSRRLLPVAILLPMTLGLIRFEARRAGLIGEDFSVSYVTVFTIFILSFVIWLYARYLNEVDIGRRTAEKNIIRAKIEAEAARKTQEEFLANMSHEIRTPMNGVIGMTSLLQNTPLNEEQKNFVETIRLSGESLLVIINDILDFSKIQAGKLELEERPFRLNNIIKETFELLSGEARLKQLSLEFNIDKDVPEFIVGDSTRLRQILVNLVSNGIKFTECGTISVGVSKKQDDENNLEIVFTVKDTGIGIPGDKLEKLFKAFSQADSSTTRKYGGTGLGLAICERLVTIMKGTITMTSESGKGTIVSFTIKSRVPEETEISDELVAPVNYEPGRPPPDLGKKIPISILVAEDNSINQKITLQMLLKLGYHADLAANGVEVIDAVHRQNYNLILMDMIMPEMDGIEATRKVRSLGLKSQPVIIALTANAMHGEREKCISNGMNDYLPKPFQLSDLEKIIRKWHREMLPPTE